MEHKSKKLRHPRYLSLNRDSESSVLTPKPFKVSVSFTRLGQG